jgi:hypothetical protein
MALSLADIGGNEAVVKLLVEAGKVNVEADGARASTSCNLSSTDKEPQLTKGFCEQPVYRMDSVCPHLPVSFLSRHPYHDT